MPGWGEAQPIGVPMAGIEKSTARVIAVLALLFVAAWALRGYLPGSEHAAYRQRPTSSPVALVVDVALLSISVAIIGFANEPFGKYLTPSLSTVDQQAIKMGEEAARLFFESDSKTFHKINPAKVILEPMLIFRDSSLKVKQ